MHAFTSCIVNPPAEALVLTSNSDLFMLDVRFMSILW